MKFLKCLFLFFGLMLAITSTLPASPIDIGTVTIDTYSFPIKDTFARQKFIVPEVGYLIMELGYVLAVLHAIYFSLSSKKLFDK